MFIPLVGTKVSFMDFPHWSMSNGVITHVDRLTFTVRTMDDSREPVIITFPRGGTQWDIDHEFRHGLNTV